MMAEATKEKQQGKRNDLTSASLAEVKKCDASGTSNKNILRRLLREENLAPTIVGPSIESQVRQLFEHDTAIAKFRTEKRVVQSRPKGKRGGDRRSESFKSDNVNLERAAKGNSRLYIEDRLQHQSAGGKTMPSKKPQPLPGTRPIARCPGCGCLVTELPRGSQVCWGCVVAAHRRAAREAADKTNQANHPKEQRK